MTIVIFLHPLLILLAGPQPRILILTRDRGRWTNNDYCKECPDTFLSLELLSSIWEVVVYMMTSSIQFKHVEFKNVSRVI